MNIFTDISSYLRSVGWSQRTESCCLSSATNSVTFTS